MSEGICTMQTADTTPARAPEDTPALVKKIGRTTYKVRIHFSQTSTETMSDKIKRMLKNEVLQMYIISIKLSTKKHIHIIMYLLTCAIFWGSGLHGGVLYFI